MVDIGCGIGAVSIPLAKMFPSLRITNHDLPGVITMTQKVSSDTVQIIIHQDVTDI
jgi:precorrin-6B methylase 2